MKVMISIPSIDGKIGARTSLSINNYLSHQHEFYIEYLLNDSNISHARNSHFGQFVNNKEFDFMLSIDSDIIIESDFSYGKEGVLDRLISRKEDYIGAIYPKKQIHSDGKLIPAGTPLKDDLLSVLDGSVIEMKAMPTGFMLMSRKCAEDMVEHYQSLYYEEDTLSCGWSWAVYNPMIIGDKKGLPRLKSEDYSFCERWKAIGGQIYCDTSIKLRHVGNFDYKMY